MNPSQIYISIFILGLAVIALLFLISKNRKDKKPTPLASVAFVLILAGILFGENRLVGYGLIGAGAVLVVMDMIAKLKK